jgi:hypothetical protein
MMYDSGIETAVTRFDDRRPMRRPDALDRVYPVK